MMDTTELNRKRALRGLPPIESVWERIGPSCKMRLLGPDNLKVFTRKFVINRMNLDDARRRNLSR